jgi:hypothetical protein
VTASSAAFALVALFTCLAGPVAIALETKTITVKMTVAEQTYRITAEPLVTWQLHSEGQVSIDQKFDIQPDGSSGLIQVKLAPIPANSTEQPNPCVVLKGVAQTLSRTPGVRVSPGRKAVANLAPVCSMIAESSLKTQFYYASVFRAGNLFVAGMARNDRDLTDAQINRFARYLASIKVEPLDNPDTSRGENTE